MCKLKEKSANNSLDILQIIFIGPAMFNLKTLLYQYIYSKRDIVIIFGI
jgi:hypothetical protein